jgi:hypothetical protein
MRNSNSGSSAEQREALLAKAEQQSKKDRNKLIVMVVGLILVAGAWAFSKAQRDNQESNLLVGEVPEFTEIKVVKKFDMSTIADKILDNREEDRVLLPSAVYEPVTEYVYGKTDEHFHALGVTDLTPELRADVEADPSAHRGTPFRVRGQLIDVKVREPLNGKKEYRGWLSSPDGTITHFIATEKPEELIYKGTLRFEGLFVKLYRTEGHDGELVDGPLLIGSRLVNSYSPLTAEDVTPERLVEGFSKIVDDTARTSPGLNGAVFDLQWQLLEYAKTDAYKAIDWENDAVELNNATMAAMLTDGDSWRSRRAGDADPRGIADPDVIFPPLENDMIPVPIRVPVSKNMGINTIDAGENPANVDVLTEGWVGNMTWSNQAGVAYFIYPGARPDLLDRDFARLIEARGFFVKNHNYESKDKGTRTAPFFVFTELSTFTPGEDRSIEEFLLWVLVAAVGLLIAFPLILMRDRKKSAALQQDLVRRKQERRRRLAANEQPQV